MRASWRLSKFKVYFKGRINQGAWLAQSVDQAEHVTLDLRVMGSNPKLDTELTFFFKILFICQREATSSRQREKQAPH